MSPVEIATLELGEASRILFTLEAQAAPIMQRLEAIRQVVAEKMQALEDLRRQAEAEAP